MKTYHIIEEETVRKIYEVKIPDDIISQGIDAVYDYWYSIENPEKLEIDTSYSDYAVVEAYEISNPILGD